MAELVRAAGLELDVSVRETQPAWDRMTGLLALGRALDELESIVSTRVDLVPLHDVKTSVAERITRDAVPL